MNNSGWAILSAIVLVTLTIGFLVGLPVGRALNMCDVRREAVQERRAYYETNVETGKSVFTWIEGSRDE